MAKRGNERVYDRVILKNNNYNYKIMLSEYKTLFTPEDIKALELENEYHTKRLLKELETVQEIKEFSHYAKLQYDQNDPSQSRILLPNRGSGEDNLPSLRINKNYKGEYNIFTYDTQNLEYIEFDDITRASEGIKKPNNVRKLSEKKLIDWIEYTNEVYRACKELSEERQKRVIDHIKAFNLLFANVDDCECYISPDQKNGRLENRFFCYTYKIEANGFIDENTKLNYAETKGIKNLEKLLRAKI